MNWNYRSTVLMLAVLANFTQMSSRLVISPLIPDILDEFTVSKTAVGFALTGMWAAYALAQFPSGLLGARFGERRVILTSLALVTLGSVCLTLSPSFVFFSFAVFFLGVGAGLYFAAAARLLSRIFDKRGQALGFITAAGSFAGLVAPVISVYLGTRYGWRSSTLFGTGLAVPVLAGVLLIVRPTEPDRAAQSLRSQLELSMVVDTLRIPSVVYSIFIAAAGTFTFQAVTSFLPTFLVEARGLSTVYAGILFGAIFLLSAVAQPITGRISDEVGRDAVIAATMLVAVVGFLAVLDLLPVVGVAGGVVVLGLGLSWFPVVVSRLMDVLPDDDQSRSFGLVRTVYMLFGSLGSIVTGIVADTIGWVPAYGVVAGILVVSVTLIGTNRLFGSQL